MIELHIANRIQKSSGISLNQVKAVLSLLEEGNTIPFIARYRKEKTQGLDEVEIFRIAKIQKDLIELDDRRKFILETIAEQGQLTSELQEKINQAQDLLTLEDLYAPYKKKKKTKADIAIENGLLPLAEFILRQPNQELSPQVKKYVCEAFPSIEQVLQGAQDIIAENIFNDVALREQIRELYVKYYSISSKLIKTKEKEATVFKDYFDYSEPIRKIPSHRFLAIERGEQLKLLRIKFIIEESEVIHRIQMKYVKNKTESGILIAKTCQMVWEKSLSESIENQVRKIMKDKSDEVAIQVFSENIRQLFMEAPLGEKKIIAIDPGFRTGSKVVVLDEAAMLLKHYTIFPLAPMQQTEEAYQKIHKDIKQYNIKFIAVGDGTGGRDIVDWLNSVLDTTDISIFNISEQGASIYSASEVAREEFPTLDLTYRGAVSIGRRLLDPMAELIKIDPKSIGIGQYQHDVNQKMLKEKLDSTLVSCVNQVGINVNTASKYLLNYISGLGNTISENIIQYRNEKGKIESKTELKKVPRLGPKAFEQCAGFIRIKDGISILDNTAILPEHYTLVDQMASSIGVSTSDFVANSQLRKAVKLADFITDKVGEYTIKDILVELDKPGLDPRGEIEKFEYLEGIRSIQDLKEGMIVNGIITNITKFGAFVDIGIKISGLIHISELSDKFISDPNEIVKLKQKVKAKVITIDINRERVQLSLKK